MDRVFADGRCTYMFHKLLCFPARHVSHESGNELIVTTFIITFVHILLPKVFYL
jgi:hypothetical protein